MVPGTVYSTYFFMQPNRNNHKAHAAPGGARLKHYSKAYPQRERISQRWIRSRIDYVLEVRL